MKLLLIEDTPGLRKALAKGLTQLGFVMEQAHDGPSGLWAAQTAQPDVILLDVMLPGFDGLELLRRLRASGNATPVLMLTALGEVEHRLSGFDAGADDYLPKPFDLRELAARARALGRRGTATTQAVIELGDLQIDVDRGEVQRDGVCLPMRRRERLLLELLAIHQGKTVARSVIQAKLYPEQTELRSNSVEAAVLQLRRWIDKPGEASRIATLRGEGYRLDQ